MDATPEVLAQLRLRAIHALHQRDRSTTVEPPAPLPIDPAAALHQLRAAEQNEAHTYPAGEGLQALAYELRTRKPDLLAEIARHRANRPGFWARLGLALGWSN